MNEAVKAWKNLGVSIAVLIALSFLLSISISLTYPVPIAQDFHFHITLAKLYAQGENALFHEEALRANNMPYPPLFHLLFVPFIWLGCHMEFGRFLQCLFYPLALTATTYLVYKNQGSRQALYCGLLLLSSIAFSDRSRQVIPQAIDMILFPLSVHFFLKGKLTRFTVVSLLMIYTHGLIALLLFLPFVLHELIAHKPPTYDQIIVRKSRSFYVLLTAFLSFPIIALSLVFLLPGLHHHLGGIQNAQEAAILQNPVGFTFPYLGPAMCLLSPFLVKVFFQLKNLDDLHKMAVYTLLSLTPMILFWPDRFLTYITMPLAILISQAVSSVKRPWLKIFLTCFLVDFAALTYLTEWGFLLNRTHHVVDFGSTSN